MCSTCEVVFLTYCNFHSLIIYIGFGINITRVHCTICAHPFWSLSLSLSLSVPPALSFSLSRTVLWSTLIVLEHSHSECIGLHFVLCNTQKVGLSCSGTRFNRLTFVRRNTQLRDTGLVIYLHWGKFRGHITDDLSDSVRPTRTVS